MAVRLQTTDGKIKEYKTAYCSRAANYEWGGCEKYATHCGLEWLNIFVTNEGCQHLDCAIHVAREDKKDGSVGFMLCVTFVALGMVVFWRKTDWFFPITVLSILLILTRFYFFIFGRIEGIQLSQLTEYKDKGTIDGIKAIQIFEDQKTLRLRANGMGVIH